MPDVITTKSLPRLQVEQELLPWAHRLVNDLFLQLLAIAEALNNLTTGGGTNHEFLSSTHTDVVPASPIRGDLITANATPEWTRLALGASGRFLRSNGSDPTWGTISKTDLPTAIAYEDETNTFSLPQILQSYLDFSSISTPADPATGVMRMYGNKTGATIEVRIRFEDGTECVVCTHSLTPVVQTLPLNWVE